MLTLMYVSNNETKTMEIDANFPTIAKTIEFADTFAPVNGYNQVRTENIVALVENMNVLDDLDKDELQTKITMVNGQEFVSYTRPSSQIKYVTEETTITYENEDGKEVTEAIPFKRIYCGDIEGKDGNVKCRALINENYVNTFEDIRKPKEA